MRSPYPKGWSWKGKFFPHHCNFQAQASLEDSKKLIREVRNFKNRFAMKNIYLSIFAAAAILLSACSKEAGCEKCTSTGRNVTFNVENGLSKTYLVDNAASSTVSMNWSEDDNQRFVAYENGVAGTTTGIDINSGKATFSVNFSAGAGAPFIYTALFGSQVAEGKATLPAVQNPVSGSYDPDADVMMSKAVTQDAAATSLSMSFAHIAAITKLTIKNLPSDDIIKAVTISADVALAGGITPDFIEGSEKAVYDEDGSKSITLNSPEGASVLYFTSFPVSMESWKVRVVTDRSIYEKSISSACILKLGELNNISVDMSSTWELLQSEDDLTAKVNAAPAGYTIILPSGYTYASNVSSVTAQVEFDKNFSIISVKNPAVRPNITVTAQTNVPNIQRAPFKVKDKADIDYLIFEGMNFLVGTPGKFSVVMYFANAFKLGTLSIRNCAFKNISQGPLVFFDSKENQEVGNIEFSECLFYNFAAKNAAGGIALSNEKLKLNSIKFEKCAFTTSSQPVIGLTSSDTYCNNKGGAFAGPVAFSFTNCEFAKSPSYRGGTPIVNFELLTNVTGTISNCIFTVGGYNGQGSIGQANAKTGYGWGSSSTCVGTNNYYTAGDYTLVNKPSDAGFSVSAVEGKSASDVFTDYANGDFTIIGSALVPGAGYSRKW